MKGRQLLRYAAGSAAAVGIGRPSLAEHVNARTRPAAPVMPILGVALWGPAGGYCSARTDTAAARPQ
jgi:hypothetical protein